MRGLSQDEISERLEVKRSSYAEWEKETVPRADIFFKIAETLSVDPVDLMKKGWEPDEKSSLGQASRIITDVQKISLQTIQTALDTLLVEQKSTRAEVRAYGQYQVTKDAGGDPEQVVKILAEIGRLVAAHESAIARGGKPADKGNHYRVP